ncbi:EGF-like domain protein [Ancylostoma ceylanicum]|uniref:EGF-like domain protein n=1 Tax=Ancylostoma ceylanicum TaxID=53326 RepID=A0A0D6M2R9_9BILA|nr:EGF-like domain protein [Ancylostoma ceylanicum]
MFCTAYSLNYGFFEKAFYNTGEYGSIVCISGFETKSQPLCTNGNWSSYDAECTVVVINRHVITSDVNECDENIDLCDPDATCMNNLGGYTCVCPPGKELYINQADVDDRYLVRKVSCIYIHCPNLDDIIDRSLEIHYSNNAAMNAIGSIIHFKCKHGHLEGPAKITCERGSPLQRDPIDSCTYKDCANGRCIIEGGEKKCECLSGALYLLIACFHFVNGECVPEACKYTFCAKTGMGKCYEHSGVAKCECGDGYGSFCEHDNGCPTCESCNVCVSVLLQQNDAVRHECLCLMGDSLGVLGMCSPDPCQDHNCGPHGGCVPNNRTELGYSCECERGWMGQECRTEIRKAGHGKECNDRWRNSSACLLVPKRETANRGCVNSTCIHGTCLPTEDDYFCRCFSGYTGKHCQVGHYCDVQINLCDSTNPCLNGGLCRGEYPGKTFCECMDDYRGETCGEKIRYCTLRPCLNNGTCEELNSKGYKCYCEEGYTGANCEADVDPCENWLCKNNGTCLLSGGRPLCHCVPEYTGPHCEKHVSRSCAVISCNTGTCFEDTNMIGHCICPPEYTGEFCETKKTSSYNLFFNGLPSSQKIVSRDFQSTFLREFTLCAWVFYAPDQQVAANVKLAPYLQLNTTTGDPILSLDNKGVAINDVFRIDARLSVMAWHHICVRSPNYASTTRPVWTVFLDGAFAANASYEALSFQGKTTFERVNGTDALMKAQIECEDKYFPRTNPEFYVCDVMGQWDRSSFWPTNRTYSFPSCGRTTNSSQNITGTLQEYGNCTTIRQRLLNSLLSDLEQYCGNCTEEISINPICHARGSGREYRSILDEPLAFNFYVNINNTRNLLKNTIDNTLHKEFPNSTLSIEEDLTCDLKFPHLIRDPDSASCADCPAGQYWNGDHCVECPEDTYRTRNDPLEKCMKCPTNTTTTGLTGQKDVTACHEICNAGEYYNEWSKKCHLCPLGTYQEKRGSTECLPCPADSTTTIIGAKNASDCSFKCGAGKELGADGRCKDCARGTYWVNTVQLTGCIDCPQGLTTASTAAKDIR